MVEAYTIEQLYERQQEAERYMNAAPGREQYSRAYSALRADYLKARSDYQRALIVEARHKQGEY